VEIDLDAAVARLHLDAVREPVAARETRETPAGHADDAVALGRDMTDDDVDVWKRVLAELRTSVPSEDFRRWFSSTSYASDSGDQITVWVPSDPVRRHLELHYRQPLQCALTAIGRPLAAIRFVVAGFGEEDEESDGE